jgi:prolyl-tRNA editing enzyme YbaK/EbsC (Cys-tRNA(Pro) deacylase)
MIPLSSIERVAAAAQREGVAIDPVEMPSSTRTAIEAAAACGCEVGEIVKSLIFTGRNSGAPYLLLVSGTNRVDEDAVASAIGEPLDRPNGRTVRELTGFAIGGIPPFGHDREISAFLDQDLKQYSRVWAAAGTPHAVFNIAVTDLERIAKAKVLCVSS